MASGLSGRLGQQSLPDLLREVVARKLTGVLRLSTERVTKSLAFDAGKPIAAFSSVPSEQLESRLVKEGHTTIGLVEAVKRSQTNPLNIGQALVEKGLVSADALSKTGSELSLQIALSLFEWREGGFQFEETPGPICPPFLDISAPDLVVEGIRQAAGSTAIADSLAPPNRSASRTELNPDHFAATARLSSLESYLLSLFTSTVRLSSLTTLTGMSDEQIRPALCVLVAVGLLTLADEAPPPEAPRPVQNKPDPLLDGISRKLRLFETANYYQILGLDNLATTSGVKSAFQGLAGMFQTYRAESPSNLELQKKLDLLFAKIEEAHNTLVDPIRRREYDLRLQPRSSAPPQSTDVATNESAGFGSAAKRALSDQPLPARSPVRKPVPIPFNIPTPVRPPAASIPEAIIERGQSSTTARNSTPPPSSGQRVSQPPPRVPIRIPEIKMPVAPKNGTAAYVERGLPEPRSMPRPPGASGPLTRPPAVLSPEEAARLKNAGPATLAEQALHFYRQGRARYERRELDAAEHLLREAVRLDPTQSHYHFHLAVVLTIRAQARREHVHHEGCHVTCRMDGKLVSNLRVRYEAEEHFRRAAEIDPSNAQIPLKLGQLYKDARLLKKAEQYLRQALMLDSRNHIAQHELDTLRDIPQDDKEDEEVDLLD